MFTLKGQIINTFHTEATKDYPESFKVQLLADKYTRTGEIKKEMFTLTLPFEEWEKAAIKIGSFVTYPVGILAKGNTIFPFYQNNVTSGASLPATTATT